MREELLQLQETSVSKFSKAQIALILKLVFGILILLSLISYDTLDPNLLNLFTPVTGISNWLSYPGALLSGTMIILLGRLSFLVPLFIIIVSVKPEISTLRAVFIDVFMIVAVGLSLMLIIPISSMDAIRFGGLIGFGGINTLVEFPGKLISLLLCTGYMILFYRSYTFNKVILSAIGIVIFQAVALFVLLSRFVSVKSSKTSNYVNERFSATIRNVSGRFVSPIKAKIEKKNLAKEEAEKAARYTALKGPLVGTVKSKNLTSKYNINIFIPDDVLSFEQSEEVKKAAKLFDEALEAGLIKI